MIAITICLFYTEIKEKSRRTHGNIAKSIGISVFAVIILQSKL